MASEDPKPSSTAELMVALLDFIKQMGPALLIMLLQLAKSKEKQAENELAYANMKEKAADEKAELDSRMATKSDRDVLVDFLNEPSPSSNPSADAGSSHK